MNAAKIITRGAIALAIIGGIVYAARPQPIPTEIGAPTKRTVRAFVAEEAKTRLADEFIVDAPIGGTVLPIEYEVGDYVEKGAIVARMDTYSIERWIEANEALIAKARAHIEGVETEKPKPEDLRTAAMRVEEAEDALRIAEREREIVAIDFNEAERDYERVQRLVREGVASQAALDEAERAYKNLEQQRERARLAEDAAKKGLVMANLAEQRLSGSIDDNEYLRRAYQAEIDHLQAQIRILESDLDKTNIRAPVNGPILEKFLDSQRVVSPGTPLLTIGNLDTLEIECDVLSEEITPVAVGNTVEIIGKALAGKTAAGTVKRIYPSAFQKISSLGIEQQRIKVLIDFDNTELGLRPGTRLDVRIITAEAPDTLAVPERATFREEGRWYVLAVEDGRAVKTPVELGIKNDEWAEVNAGIEPNAQLVLEPTNDITDGARVVKKR